MRSVLRVALLAMLVLTQAGCVAEIVFGGGSLIASVFGIYQRREARQAQDEQTAEIKALREEIARLRAKWAAPMPFGGDGTLKAVPMPFGGYMTPNAEPGIIAPPLTGCIPVPDGGYACPDAHRVFPLRLPDVEGVLIAPHDRVQER